MKKPFFAKFLECQIKEEDRVKGGIDLTTKIKDFDQTMKAPSDDDENVTHKYPSDGDENVTHKYPSDNDEGYQTMKAPSDSDEGQIM